MRIPRYDHYARLFIMINLKFYSDATSLEAFQPLPYLGSLEP